MGIGERIGAWLRFQPHRSRGSLAEFDTDPVRYSLSRWIKDLAANSMINADVLIVACDAVDISSPRKRSGHLFLRDLLRLERAIRWGSPGLFTAMGDDLLRSIYHEEYVRLLADLGGRVPESLRPGAIASVVAVQQAAYGFIVTARQGSR